MSIRFVAVALCTLLFPLAAFTQATDVECVRCVQQKDIDFGAIGTGRLQKQSVTRDRLAPDAVGAAAIDPTEVQARVKGECGESAFAFGVEEDGTIMCSLILGGAFTVSSGSGVASVNCPQGGSALSANCDCDNVNGTRNYGVLFGCQVAPGGAAAGCFPEAGTYNPGLPSPLATVTVVCTAETIVPPVASALDDVETIRRRMEVQTLDFESRLRNRAKQ